MEAQVLASLGFSVSVCGKRNGAEIDILLLKEQRFYEPI